jgi:hypothetical protein
VDISLICSELLNDLGIVYLLGIIEPSEIEDRGSGVEDRGSGIEDGGSVNMDRGSRIT